MGADKLVKSFTFAVIWAWSEKYDNEGWGLTEWALINSVNPSNSLSYGVGRKNMTTNGKDEPNGR
jgi:hypothetical protein